MSAQGEAWIESRGRRALERALVSPLLPAAGGIAVANAARQNTYEVERALYPGHSFAMKKLGDPSRDSFALRWFRRAMMDELPQIMDVWQGSMTLIGPRADKPEHIRQLFDAIDDADLRDHWKEVRFRQRPGIISSYAVHSHRNNLEGLPENVRFSEDEEIAANAALRATLDIADFEAASLAHDASLIVATAKMAVANYAHYARGVILPPARTAET